MKSFLPSMLIIIFSLTSPYAHADETEKNFYIGLGTYSVTLDYSESTPLIEDDKFSGAALNLTYALNNNVAIRGVIFGTDYDENSLLEASGLDLSILAGTGLSTNGFKIYGGAGVFTETWEVTGFANEEKFSGIQFVGGLGYNWDVISLDLSLAYREADDYADFISVNIGGTGKISVRVVSFAVSARF